MALYICIVQKETQERFFFIEIGLVRLEKDGRGHPFFFDFVKIELSHLKKSGAPLLKSMIPGYLK